MKITLESLYTPWTLDMYQTFNMDNTEDRILEDLNNYDENGVERPENSPEITYDDVEWKYDMKGYGEALAKNRLQFLRDNIIDKVILAIDGDNEISSPQFYNYTADKTWNDFEVDIDKLKKYIADNQADYDKNKIKDAPGFMWFGDENETMLEYYLANESVKNMGEDEYYYNQIENVDAMEFIEYKLIKK